MCSGSVQFTTSGGEEKGKKKGRKEKTTVLCHLQPMQPMHDWPKKPDFRGPNRGHVECGADLVRQRGGGVRHKPQVRPCLYRAARGKKWRTILSNQGAGSGSSRGLRNRRCRRGADGGRGHLLASCTPPLDQLFGSTMTAIWCGPEDRGSIHPSKATRPPNTTGSTAAQHAKAKRAAACCTCCGTAAFLAAGRLRDSMPVVCFR